MSGLECLKARLDFRYELSRLVIVNSALKSHITSLEILHLQQSNHTTTLYSSLTSWRPRHCTQTRSCYSYILYTQKLHTRFTLLYANSKLVLYDLSSRCLPVCCQNWCMVSLEYTVLLNLGGLHPGRHPVDLGCLFQPSACNILTDGRETLTCWRSFFLVGIIV